VLKFYALPLSSYCAKARIVLRLKSVDFEELVPIGGSYNSTEYQTLVAAGSIPALHDGDFILHDSDAIIEYLDDSFPEPALRPRDNRQRALMRAIGRYHDGRLEPAVRVLFPFIKETAENLDQNAVRLAKDALFDRLYRLDRLINPQPYLFGDQLTLADCAYPTTLRMAQDLLEALGQSLDLPVKIDNWIQELEKHPIIGDEVLKNRASVAIWIASFSVQH
jgi:glutathione S-transferase